MTTLPSSYREGFTKMYAGNPPWDIGRPQAPFIATADQIVGPVLDSGCGTGNTAIFLAARGLEVTGIDFVAEAIERARAKAALGGLNVRFEVKDAMTLDQWDQRFNSAIDSGLYHIYDQEKRRAYVGGLKHVLHAGGKLFLLSFTDSETSVEGGVSEAQLRDDFADGWEVESVSEARGEVSPAFAAEQPQAFSGGGAKMWFAIIRKL